jgi:hypothetical protein
MIIGYLCQNFVSIGQGRLRGFQPADPEKWPLLLEAYVVHTTKQSANALQCNIQLDSFWAKDLRLLSSTCGSNLKAQFQWQDRIDFQHVCAFSRTFQCRIN